MVGGGFGQGLGRVGDGVKFNSVDFSSLDNIQQAFITQSNTSSGGPLPTNIGLPTNAISELGSKSKDGKPAAGSTPTAITPPSSADPTVLRKPTALKNPMAVINWHIASEDLLPIDFTSSFGRNGSDPATGNTHGYVMNFTLKSQQTDTSGLTEHSVGEARIFEILYVLSMHVPPSEITYTYSKEISKNKARGNWVIEHWGDNMLSIECSGQTGVFYRSDMGLTRTYAQYTYAHYELMQMLQMYRNNGMSYDPTYGVVDTISEITLTYDDKTYRGCFDAFNVRENAEQPYRFDYDFIFVARGESDTRVTGHFVQVTGENTKTIRVKNLSEIAGDLNTKYSAGVDKDTKRVTQLFTGAIQDDLVDRSVGKIDPKQQAELAKQYVEIGKGVQAAYAPKPATPDKEAPKKADDLKPGQALPPGKSVLGGAPAVNTAVKNSYTGASIVMKDKLGDTVLNVQEITNDANTKTIIFGQGTIPQADNINRSSGISSLSNVAVIMPAANTSGATGATEFGAGLHNDIERDKKKLTELGVKKSQLPILFAYSGAGYSMIREFVANPGAYSKLILADAAYPTYYDPLLTLSPTHIPKVKVYYQTGPEGTKVGSLALQGAGYSVTLLSCTHAEIPNTVLPLI